MATALTRAAARGVKIRVVADVKSHGSIYSALTFLANHQVEVRLNDRYAIMHNKVMIADNRHVKTGSFNYSAAANKSNAENVLVIGSRLLGSRPS
ncbi:phospholipase D-like domain-containing protein [Klebsiella variicola]|uniref:phospholipase D-like domain-containing protein n=1 Tax=Klebsiella variicola TaxID=244366 RepID=UPI001FA7665B